MAEFVWEARARTGELRKGLMEAESEDAVNTAPPSAAAQPTKVKKKGKGLRLSARLGRRQKDLVTFTRLFATMIDAGLPIVQCLDILQGQTDNKNFAVVFEGREGERRAGRHLQRLAAPAPEGVRPLYTNLVQAGEVGGILDTI
jgi:type IV pilus assembly protein PilC